MALQQACLLLGQLDHSWILELGPLAMLGIVVVSTILLFTIGNFFARTVKMPDYGWKIGLIMLTVVAGSAVTFFGWPPKLGIDLSGGVILIYEVDAEASGFAEGSADEDAGANRAEPFHMADLIARLKIRVNPGGVKEVVIRPFGSRQVEFIIPEVKSTEVDHIKKLITTSGVLKFRIMANRQADEHVVRMAQKETDDARREGRRQKREIRDERGELIGEWVHLGHEEDSSEDNPVYKVSANENNLTRELEQGRMEVLMKIDGFNVTGDHLRSASAGIENLSPCINFNMSASGAARFGGLTSSNNSRRLGIIMDNELLSAPVIRDTITDRGQITGRFTQQEVDLMVELLKAGSLPVVLKDNPSSESEISATLGAETIRSGGYAIVASLCCVLVFMLVYYRMPGLVACCALATNLVLILGVMILFRAAFTLPGLAGLVLTVGMSVDANVLIFERIREELQRGSALRMAIRNGFSRATTTIVDANLTTLITAIVLYTIGTDQIRGFAVTLALGILMSMYTAIFCSRVIFDISEKRRWITQLSMMQLVGKTQIDFIGKRRLAAACSIGLIAIGLCGVLARNTEMFDIDFNGGTSLEIVTVAPMSYGAVRERVDRDWNVLQHTMEGRKDRVYKFETPLEDIDQARKAVQEAFTDDQGKSLLVMYQLSFTPSTPVTGPWGPGEDTLDSESPAGSSRGAVPDPTGPRQAKPVPPEPDGTDTGVRSDLPVDTLLAFTGNDLGLLAQADSSAESTDETPAPGDSDEAAGSPDDEESSAGDGIESAQFSTYVRSTLTFEKPEGAIGLRLGQESDYGMASRDALEARIEAERDRLGLSGVDVNDLVSNEDGTEWVVTLAADAEQADAVLSSLESNLENSPVWISSSKIGTKVAGNTRTRAIVAMLTSLLGIVGYIWIRFQRVMFGLAAVVALVHDVLITLGALALSHWLAEYFGFLLISDFKINLPIVAAFLTIIGYSLNDTIVVFDRIREVRGKSPDLTEKMVNTSINQTLSRTLLTSFTTMMVVIILYIWGGNSIHGFAFALVVGVGVGTYSSIFVASPILIWLAKSDRSTRISRKEPVSAA